MSPGDLVETRVEGRPDQADQPSAETILAVLRELVRLKDLKDREGATADYRRSKDAAWNAARRVLASDADQRRPIKAAAHNAS